ncbi:MAG: endonuclease V [Anaerolineae bacterium]|nr:endonuclease V [Anaerolineae bacterium]
MPDPPSGEAGAEGASPLHRWDVTPREAAQIQSALRGRVQSCPLSQPPRTIGGLDVHGDRGAVAVLAWPGLEWVGGAIAELPVTFPYVPGLLSFREAPVLLAAIDRLGMLPDVLLCDGQGSAHPRRFGLACHLGLWLGCPTIGCAKTRLCGRHAELGEERGARVPLRDGDDVIGAVVRTRTRVRPVYVSIGHLICLEEAIELTLGCARRYRLPEPLRTAHRMARSGRCPAPG